MDNIITNDYRTSYIESFNVKLSNLNIKLDYILVEQSIYEYCISYVKLNNMNDVYIESIYKTKCNEILKCLNPANLYLIDALQNNIITIDDLPCIRPQILNKKQWDSIVNRQEYIEFKKNNMATSDNYECRKCKQRKCYVYQQQTRSADEPMTTFITCQVCGNKWQF